MLANVNIQVKPQPAAAPAQEDKKVLGKRDKYVRARQIIKEKK